MNPNSKYLRFLYKPDIIEWFLLVVFLVCKFASSSEARESKEDFLPLIHKIDIFIDVDCDSSIEQLLAKWSTLPIYSVEEVKSDFVGTDYCYWSKITLKNETEISQSRVLYFSKGWSKIDVYLPDENKNFTYRQMGWRNNQEVVEVLVPAQNSFILFARYPSYKDAILPSLHVRELTKNEFQKLSSRNIYQFFLLGALFFYVLFFLAQFVFIKDQLNFYYVVFLTGATAHLITMVESIPFFDYCPKTFAKIINLQYLFLISTVVTLFGLMKYLQHFLQIGIRAPRFKRYGEILIVIFALILMVPFAFPTLLRIENYGEYLQYFRTLSLLNILYILSMTIWGVYKKIQFSRILLFSFLPFIFSATLYAISFIVGGGLLFVNAQSLILIAGFLLTLLMFGALLGVRNYSVRKEKILLEQRANYLHQLNDFKSTFYTNFTHEFRTPLTVIKGMADQIQKQDRIKHLIKSNSDRILKLVNQVLDLSKLESGKMQLQWVHGDVIPFLKYLTESCHSQAVEKNISLAFFSDLDSLEMNFDELKLEQILINLISNAIKYTPEYGSVKVVVKKHKDDGKWFLKLVVEDTGKGIAKGQLRLIFDQFYQAEEVSNSLDNKTHYQNFDGFGIGLSLVKELVSLLSGFISVTSEPGRGSKFLITLPINHEASIPYTQKELILPLENKPIYKKAARYDATNDQYVALIIEDNRDVAEYILSCLKPEFNVLMAENGKNGLEKALETIPDIIICDVMMPEIDGFQVCNQIKNNPKTSHIPFILLTAKATSEDRKRGLSYGADAYLVKPFDKEELLIRISGLIRQRQKLVEKFSNHQRPISPLNGAETREVAFINKLNEIIHKHLDNEKFNSNYLCREIAMSRTQLYRKIKAVTGKSIGQFIRGYRLDQARSMLEKTDLPIGEIASLVGYKDFSHFSKSFMQEYGIRPSETRT